MIALDTPITIPLIGQFFGRAWNWWVGELKQAIPAPLIGRLQPPRPQIDIYVSPAEAIISQRAENGWEELGRFGLSGAGEAGLGLMIDVASKPDVHVRLANSLVLRRELDLPRVAETRLRDVIGFDLDRLTPLTADTGVFDVLVREHDPAAGRVRVSLVVAKRQTIDRIILACERLGVFPRSIRVAEASGSVAEFNLLADAERTAGRRIWRRPWLVAAAAIGLLIVTNVVLAFEREAARVSLLSTELAKTRKASQATEKLRAQLSMNQAEARLLMEAQSQAGPLEVLQDLSRLLPDDAWLFACEMRKGSVRISGLAPSASDLIALLDKSEILTNPRFSGAVTRADRPGNERFEITLDLRGKKTK